MVFLWFSSTAQARGIALQRRETGAVAGRFLGLAALAVKLHLERKEPMELGEFLQSLDCNVGPPSDVNVG